MEHNTDRIMWTVLILAIGVALYVGFHPAANGLLHQGVDKTQAVMTNTGVGTNLLTETHANWQSQSIDNTNNPWCLQDGITVHVKKNTEYTAQSEIKSDVKTDPWHIEVWGYLNDTTSAYTMLNHGQETNVNGSASKVTFNSGDYTRIVIMPHVASLHTATHWSNGSTSKAVYWRHEKLEEGSNATDWNL